MMFRSIDDIQKTVIPIIKRDTIDLRRVIVFGSYAKGSQAENSDLDIFIDGRLRYSLEDTQDTEQKLSEALSMPVDLITRSALESSVIRDRLRQSIEDDGLLIYG